MRFTPSARTAPAVTRLPLSGETPAAAAGEDPAGAGATVRDTASQLVLALYPRVPVASLTVIGDGNLFDLLLAWDSGEQDRSGTPDPRRAEHRWR